MTDQPTDPKQSDGLLTKFRRPHAELWAAHRDVVLAAWILSRPGTRPSLWWQFEAPEPLPRRESELAYLLRHRLLAPGEAERAAARLKI